MTINVRKALYLAQREVGSISKDSTAEVKNKEGKFLYKYAYTSSEDMVAHCREALHKHGLSWEMTGYDVEAPLPGFGCPTLVGRFELCHGETGEVLERTYKMPIASRNDADKATSGAITYLLGQATRLLLMVPKVSDDDAANNPDRRTESHGGWEHRGAERKVTPARSISPRDDHPTRDVNAPIDAKDADGLTNTTENRELANALVAKLKRHLPGLSTAGMRREARVSETGHLSPEALVKFIRWARERLRGFEDDPMPDWADGSQRNLDDEIDMPATRITGSTP